MSLQCEKCSKDDYQDNVTVRFDFGRGQYRCGGHHSGYFPARPVIKRTMVTGSMISHNEQNDLMDETISSEDGVTPIRKSDGKPVEDWPEASPNYAT